MSTPNALVGTLASLLNDGRALGAQYYVSVGGRVVAHGAIGERMPGVAMGEDSLHKVWCASKPIATVAALALLGIDVLDAPVGAVVGRTRVAPRLADVTIGALLDHRAGVAGPLIPELLVMGARARAAALANVRMRDAAAGPAAYNDFVAWAVLACAVEQHTGRDPNRVVQEWIDTITADVFFTLTADGFRSMRERIGLYSTCSADGAQPWPHDFVYRVAQETTGFAFGAYVTMAALGRFYEWLIKARPYVQLVLDRRDAAVPDAVLGRTCQFSTGFMVGLREHGLGTKVGADAIGHNGWLGTSVGLVDPRRELVACVLVNGMEAPELLAQRWADIIDAVCTETDDGALCTP